jgi:hypothetical protein
MLSRNAFLKCLSVKIIQCTRACVCANILVLAKTYKVWFRLAALARVTEDSNFLLIFYAKSGEKAKH